MSSHTCTNFCCSPFTTFKDKVVTRLSDLKNDIHPIFKRDNFPNISEYDYEDIEPSLRLASLLLQSDAALPFIIKTFDGELRIGDNDKMSLEDYYFEMTDNECYSEWEAHLYCRPEQIELNPQNRQRVSHLLKCMQDMVQFQFGTDKENSLEDQEVKSAEGQEEDSSEEQDNESGQGQDDESDGDQENSSAGDQDDNSGTELGSCAARSGCLTQHLQQEFPRGCQCYIRLTKTFLDGIRGLTDMTTGEEAKDFSQHSQNCTASNRNLHCSYEANRLGSECFGCKVKLRLLIGYFELADTLVHELAHAAWKASCGGTWEVSQRHRTSAENGFELMSQLFGGLVYVYHSNVDHLPLRSISGCCNNGNPRPGAPAVVLSQWPNIDLESRYITNSNILSQFCFEESTDIHHRVSFAFLSDLFSTKFWRKVEKEGPSALKAPKVGTWFFIPDIEGGPYKQCSAEENAEQLAYYAKKTRMQAQCIPHRCEDRSPKEQQVSSRGRKRQMSSQEGHGLPAGVADRFLPRLEDLLLKWSMESSGGEDAN